MKFVTFIMVFAILSGLGCGNQPNTNSQPNLNSQIPPTPQVTLPSKPNKVHVTKLDFGESWPLTVEEGDIELIDGTFAVFHSNGKSYALNGSAKSKGFPEIDPIWAPNPSIPGAKKNISVLIDKALALK